MKPHGPEMSSAWKLVRTLSVYGIGAVATRLIAVLLVPLFTRSFSVSEYGQIELVSTVIVVMGFAVMLGMDTAVWRFYYDVESIVQRRRLVSTGYTISIAFSVFTCIALIILSRSVSAVLLGSSSRSSVIVWAALYLPAELIVQCSTNLLRLKFAAVAFNAIAVAQLLFGIFFAVAFVTVLRWGLSGVFAAQTCASIATSLLALPLIRKDITWGISFSFVMPLLRFGLPLVPASLALWTMSLADRLFIAHFQGQTELGIYGVANKVSGAMAIAVTAFALAWGPFAMSISKYDYAHKTYTQILRYYTVAALAGALIITAFAPAIIVAFASNAYVSGYVVVAPLTFALATLGAYSIFSIGLTLANRTQYLAISQCVGAVVHVVLNFALIPKWGMSGAALSTVVSMYIALQLLYYSAQRAYRIDYPWRALMFACVCALICGLGITALQQPLASANVVVAIAVRLSIPVLFLGICLSLRIVSLLPSFATLATD